MRISLREWAGLIVISSLFFVSISHVIFSRITLQNQHSSQNFKYNQALIEINVSGEVISPGVYKFPPGIRLKDILDVAGLAPNADKEKIFLHGKFYISSDVFIPTKQIKIKKGKNNKCESVGMGFIK